MGAFGIAHLAILAAMAAVIIALVRTASRKSSRSPIFITPTANLTRGSSDYMAAAVPEQDAPVQMSANKSEQDAPLQMSASKYCQGCGSLIHLTALQCPRCGAPQGAASGRSKIAAGLLALFLGGFGVHKFYLGRGGQGVVYLLFCWTLIPSVIALVEGIIYLTMSDVDFSAKYG
jgi:hypothetical protein